MFSIESLTESMTLAWNDLRWCLVVLVIVKLSLRGDVDAVSTQAPDERGPDVVTQRRRQG